MVVWDNHALSSLTGPFCASDRKEKPAFGCAPDWVSRLMEKRFLAESKRRLDDLYVCGKMRSLMRKAEVIGPQKNSPKRPGKR